MSASTRNAGLAECRGPGPPRAGWRPAGAAIASEPLRSGPTAALDALDAELLRHDSATLALERWCGARGGVPDARVAAELLERRAEGAPSDARRRRLRAAPAEAVLYRRVRLRCGARVLSEAENWYVPGRLTPAMNDLLDSTDIPFGRVVRELGFTRRLLAVSRLWSPAAGGGLQADTSAAARIPEHVLRHHALLLGADGVPLGEVLETYTRDALFLPEVRT